MEEIMKDLKVDVLEVDENVVIGKLMDNHVRFKFAMGNEYAQRNRYVKLEEMCYTKDNKIVNVSLFEKMGFNVNLNLAKFAYLRNYVKINKVNEAMRRERLENEYNNSNMLKLYKELEVLNDICEVSITSLESYIRSVSLNINIKYKTKEFYGSLQIYNNIDRYGKFKNFSVNNYDSRNSCVKNPQTIIKNVRKYYAEKIEFKHREELIKKECENNLAIVKKIFSDFEICKGGSSCSYQFEIHLKRYNRITIFYYENISMIQVLGRRMSFEEANKLFKAMTSI